MFMRERVEKSLGRSGAERVVRGSRCLHFSTAMSCPRGKPSRALGLPRALGRIISRNEAVLKGAI
jgi:hypothetical protein